MDIFHARLFFKRERMDRFVNVVAADYALLNS